MISENLYNLSKIQPSQRIPSYFFQLEKTADSDHVLEMRLTAKNSIKN